MRAFWKRMKWVILSVAAGVGIILAFLLRGLFIKERPDGTKEDALPDVGEPLKEKVRQAEEEALVARVEARVEAENQREELAEITKIDDGAERRRRLAEMLRRLK